ncbi:MAG: single-stranded DNA-binding protein [Anaerovorax sp.]
MESIRENELDTNRAVLSGVSMSIPVFSHKSYGETFFKFTLGIERKSQYLDQIQVVFSERLISETDLEEGSKVKISGQIRTYNELCEGKNKLIIVVFAREVEIFSEDEELKFENEIKLEGYLCKSPMKRVSPLGRELCDVMLAVNRMYNKSDYIPCIAWGRNAGYTATLQVGDKLSVLGRLQSREYRKKDGEENIMIKVAYEVSILRLGDDGFVV